MGQKADAAKSVASSEDTITAIATPLGEGGLGVVRLSGPKSLAIADEVFSHPTHHLSKAKTHSLHHGWIKKGNEMLDEAVAGVFLSPNSYTGEDVVEFSCHGSPAVLKEVLSLCQKKGARLAHPGEFTQRAYLNGKLDLAQAEAVADLIHAQSSAARATATDQLRGQLSKKIKELRQQLVDLLAHIEANLDFVEEDIPGLEKKKMVGGLSQIENEIETLLSTSLRGRLLRDGIHIALVGKPNVGKSSLFNAFLATDRAIVTDIPGTTRDTLSEPLVWDGFAVTLTDTAGLRETGDVVEREGTKRSKRIHQQADLTVFILDGSKKIDHQDKRIYKDLNAGKILLAVNKADQELTVKPQEVEKVFKNANVTMVSALKRTGLEELKKKILALVMKDVPEVNGSLTLTNMRHIHHLEAANTKIKQALTALQDKKTEEALAVDLRQGVEELSQIIGESVTDDILTSIFKQFCIGK